MKSRNVPEHGVVGAAQAGDRIGPGSIVALRARLKRAGLRPTRQRIALGSLLLGAGPRHVTAESLFEEARRAGAPLSLATVYNALRQFTAAGLLREIAIEGSRTHFDTNTAHHHHFMVDGELFDIGDSIEIAGAPPPPEGMEVDRIDVVIRLRPKSSS